MGAGSQLPGWVRPGVEEIRDVLFLALDLVERPSREAAGIATVIQWLLGASAGPVTGRTDGVHRRNVAIVELCAAEHMPDDGPVPPMDEVCRHYEVAYQALLPVDVEFTRGVWLGSRWALGESSLPPVQIPIRSADGSLLSATEIYSELLRRGQDQAAVRREATELVEFSRRLASVVEDVASRFGN